MPLYWVVDMLHAFGFVCLCDAMSHSPLAFAPFRRV